ncbi:MAG: dihydropteroate synthase [Myxococcaceae bacterium]|nr:dihydropteroate synthase [Myxococcaceae bacterium]
MLIARVMAGADVSDLAPAFDRMGLSSSAREYLLEKIPALHLLLTGLEREDARLLRSRSEGGEVPGREEFPSFVPGDQNKRPGSALLSGRREQMERLASEARADGREALAAAIERALRSLGPPPDVVVGGATWSFGGRLRVMGIVNVTPDSFSDGGRFFDPEGAIAHGVALAEAGADMLDVGGESTRPGSGGVPEEEEQRRVLPVIRGLRERLPSMPLSIDTRKHAVARDALLAGANFVNDITGFRHDPKMVEVIAHFGVPCCAMHIQGTPETMQKQPHYEDAVAEILEYLEESVANATRAGIPRERVFVDPGIGFGKTFAHNHYLLRRLRDFRLLGQPVLVGPSRKAFLGALAGGKPAPERVLSTTACAAAIVMTGGADVIRVHDVAEVRVAIAVAEAIRTARDGGTLSAAR